MWCLPTPGTCVVPQKPCAHAPGAAREPLDRFDTNPEENAVCSCPWQDQYRQDPPPWDLKKKPRSSSHYFKLCVSQEALPFSRLAINLVFLQVGISDNITYSPSSAPQCQSESGRRTCRGPPLLSVCNDAMGDVDRAALMESFGSPHPNVMPPALYLMPPAFFLGGFHALCCLCLSYPEVECTADNVEAALQWFVGEDAAKRAEVYGFHMGTE